MSRLFNVFEKEKNISGVCNDQPRIDNKVVGHQFKAKRTADAGPLSF